MATRTSRQKKSRVTKKTAVRAKKKPNKKALVRKTVKKKGTAAVSQTRRVVKKHSPLRLKKPRHNPIIMPRGHHDWESWQVFNPGVVDLHGRVRFVYRAIGHDAMSRLGYASSLDGFSVDERLPYPVYEHRLSRYGGLVYSPSGGSWGGSEDPRLTYIEEDDRVYMTYTACDGGLGVALTSIPRKDFVEKRWNWKRPVIISSPHEVHKNWVLFPEKFNGKYALLHSIKPEIGIEYLSDLEFENGWVHSHWADGKRPKSCWDHYIRGAGAPPLKTPYGWLLFYHANSKKDGWRYKVGALLLDLNDPTKILARSPEPLLEPDSWYEHEGFKAGIVYVSGVAVRDGELLVYYGGADSYVCVAHADFETFLNELKTGGRPRLKQTRVTKAA